MGNAATVPVHPLKAWRTADDRQFSAADVSALIESRGFNFKERTVIAVEDGWRRPKYDVCEVIEKITNGAVTIPQLRHWPLRGERRTKKKRAA